MTRITRRDAANVIAEYFSSLAEYRGGAYDEYQVLDSKGRTWNLKIVVALSEAKAENINLKEFEIGR